MRRRVGVVGRASTPASGLQTRLAGSGNHNQAGDILLGGLWTVPGYGPFRADYRVTAGQARRCVRGERAGATLLHDWRLAKGWLLREVTRSHAG